MKKANSLKKAVQKFLLMVGSIAPKYVGAVRSKMAIAILDNNNILYRNGSVQRKGLKSMGNTGFRVFRR